MLSRVRPLPRTPTQEPQLQAVPTLRLLTQDPLLPVLHNPPGQVLPTAVPALRVPPQDLVPQARRNRVPTLPTRAQAPPALLTRDRVPPVPRIPDPVLRAIRVPVHPHPLPADPVILALHPAAARAIQDPPLRADPAIRVPPIAVPAAHHAAEVPLPEVTVADDKTSFLTKSIG